METTTKGVEVGQDGPWVHDFWGPQGIHGDLQHCNLLYGQISPQQTDF